jgi:hypothetical protein
VLALKTKVTRPLGALRATLVFGARAEAGMAGRCASHVFSGLACSSESRGRMLVCR